MTVEDSTNPLPPQEDSSKRVVGDTEITLHINYFETVQVCIFHDVTSVNFAGGALAQK